MNATRGHDAAGGSPFVPPRDRQPTGSRSHRPAVVETVDTPASTSDGRTSSSSSRHAEARPLASQIVVFAAIGVVSTAAWAVLYLLLRGVLASVPANGIALFVTAIGNTAANRHLTFGVSGRRSVLRDHAAGLIAFGLALGMTSGAVMGLDVLVPHAGRIAELGLLAFVNLVASSTRFVLLRTWIGRPAISRTSPGRLHSNLERIPS
jgi:putative flippase GtrA